MSRRTRRRITPLITVAGAAGAVLLSAGAATAHVRVIGDVIPGKPATLQFRVPSELAEATTVRITVEVPTDLMITSVPKLDGWNQETLPGTGGKGTQLVWTAEQGHEIQPAQSETFQANVGPVPDRYSLTFNTEQTYSNGTSVAWNQPKTGDEEPEFPAPVLVVDPEASPPPGSADGAQQPGTSASAPAPSIGAPSVDTATPAPAAAEESDSGSSGPLIAVIAAGVAVAAGLTVAVLRRRGARDGSRA
ncbi:DUF1775 domain-containing protein [Streptomyces sp. ME03-5684b]|uniref:DUF1775 domain-containing protein n=1 Tax=Streptomyces sp. ME03-5684b TaxID=3028681 RepID=UPI0029B3A08C|nr:DUF1775 domain-containing protein [Streptomyces sp. ME03-5684b]MDX3319718.1 DUF1775 domain-containing protein [Streptomyces sp. ME03-5684b]